MVWIMASYPLGIAHHRVYAHVHALDGDAGVLADLILDLTHDGAAGGGDVDAVLHDNMQADGDGVVLVVDDLDALAHGLLAQQMDQAVGHGPEGHALHAEAVGGRVAGDIGEHRVADADLTLRRL